MVEGRYYPGTFVLEMEKEFYEEMHILDPNGQEVAYHNQIPDYASAEK